MNLLLNSKTSCAVLAIISPFKLEEYKYFSTRLKPSKLISGNDMLPSVLSFNNEAPQNMALK
eukprot:CAMPEP_0168539592 /NCGR_PEP_ID=MMETSP0405-20121227/21926_1 /TAXON_ID=498012 /ORGANISM="Trichosphaerium sp, Strain Am-I-7 wt" /LENGTH=61 /DNA_ID=CAMNT_0008569197 /DNA_START=289 /DNA_END=474 /DNA_ORIENTATION=-